MSTNAAEQDVELLEVRDFLARVRPFDRLDADRLAELARHMDVRFYRKGARVLDEGQENQHLYILRSGAVELHEMGEAFRARLGEGDCFAYPSLLRDNVIRHRVTAVEDTLVYRLEEECFHRLRGAVAAVDRYFAAAEADRLRRALKEHHTAHTGFEESALVATKVGDLLRSGRLVSTSPETQIAQAVKTMAAEDVSTLLIVSEAGLEGIFTDKDLRRRVVADGVALDAPISQAMTPKPKTLATSARALDALLLMSRHNIHHLPLTDPDGALAGIISTNDILVRLSSHAVHVTARIGRADSAEEVAAAAKGLRDTLVSLVDAGVPALEVSRFITLIGETAMRRLVALAQAQLGPPPVAYAFLVFGSMARGEQTGLSDQDNGLLLADGVSDRDRDGYFKDMAMMVSDGLAAAGYAYCPGNIMATNDRWRQPLGDWKEAFAEWIAAPSPQALMHAGIFFDIATVAGDVALTDALVADLLERIGTNRIFLAHLAGAALAFGPPLGFFRQLVTMKDKEHKDTLDLKVRGTAPVVEIARVHALASSIAAANTDERLSAATAAGALSEEAAANLRDAYEFIARTRLRHQARQIKAGDAPDNFVSPRALSAFERDHLKDAFAVVRRHQEYLEQKYRGGRG